MSGPTNSEFEIKFRPELITPPNPKQQDQIIAASLTRDWRILGQPDVSVSPSDRQRYSLDIRRGKIGVGQWVELLGNLPTNLRLQADRRNPVDLFQKIDDPHMKWFIGRVLVERSGQPIEHFTAADLTRFMSISGGLPNAYVFDKRSASFLDEIEKVSGPEKRAQYEHAIQKLGNILYGSQWEYWQQIKLLTAGSQSANPNKLRSQSNRYTPKPLEPTKPSRRVRGPEYIRAAELKRSAEIAASTIGFQSERHPVNEDRVLTNREKKVIGVFDGMGGHNGGEVASSISQQEFARAANNLSTNPSVQEVRQGYLQAAHEASNRMRIEERKNPELKGMGTTATVSTSVFELGRRIEVICHVGDSRLYAIKRDGRFVQITRDQSWVERDRDSGKLSDNQANYISHLLENATAQAQIDQLGRLKTYWENKNQITNALQSDNANPSILAYEVQQDDVAIIASSDGESENLHPNERGHYFNMPAVLAGQQSLQQAVNVLTNYAYNFSKTGRVHSKPDDITIAAKSL